MIAIVDTGGANIASVSNALTRLGAESYLATTLKDLKKATRVILPGVSSANHSMAILKQKDLVEPIKNLKIPVLGICSGMHILFESSEEGDTECLGIFKEKVRIIPKNLNLTIPHMGWNNLTFINKNQKLISNNISNSSYFYFVHSFYVEPFKHTIAEGTYGKKFSAIVNKENFYGTQFHPEKSSKMGNNILEEFLKL